MQVTVTAANGTGSFNVDAEAIILCEPRNGGSYLTIDRNTGASDQIEVVEAPSTIATDSGNLLFQATLVPVPLVVQAAFAFDGLSGSFIIGERVNFNQGFATLQSISGSNMVLVDYTGASISDNSIIVGADSGARCLVNGSVTFSYPQAVSTYINVGRCHELKPYSVGLSSLVYDYAVPKLETLFTTLTEAQLVAASAAAGGGGSGWSLTGNAGTTGSNFIGTTDAVPLSIKTNSVERISIDGSTGGLSVNTDAGGGVGSALVTNPTASSINNQFGGTHNGTIAIDSSYVYLDYTDASSNYLGLVNTGVGIGIGTTTPSYKLDVVGDLQIVDTNSTYTQTITSRASDNYIRLEGFDNNTNTGARIDVNNSGATLIGIDAAAYDNIQFQVAPTGITGNVQDLSSNFTALTWNENVFAITGLGTGGSVGVGTTTPTEKLDVAGTAKANTLTLTTVPAYDDDAAAGVGGLVTGQIYQTTGSGAAPLNVAGILMIKQ